MTNEAPTAKFCNLYYIGTKESLGYTNNQDWAYIVSAMARIIMASQPKLQNPDLIYSTTLHKKEGQTYICLMIRPNNPTLNAAFDDKLSAIVIDFNSKSTSLHDISSTHHSDASLIAPPPGTDLSKYLILMEQAIEALNDQHSEFISEIQQVINKHK